MVKTLQFRRGNTATVSAITAAEGEILIDTDKDTIIVGDGILAGGFVLARDDKAIAAFNTTNSAFASINSNWSVTNTSLGIANAAYASVNSNWTVMNALYTVANSAYGAANNAGGADTVARTTANLAYTQANNSRTTANAAYTAANNAGADTVARATANAAFLNSNSAFYKANNIGVNDITFYNNVYFNADTTTLQIPVIYQSNTATVGAASWSSVSSLNYARAAIAGAGKQSDALAIGGRWSPDTGTTEMYNGTSWSIGGELNTRRVNLTASGESASAALAISGYTSGPSYAVSTAVEKYNGTSWTNMNSVSTGRRYPGAAGTATDTLMFGGEASNGSLPTATEHFTGSTWSSGANMSQGIEFHVGTGDSYGAFAISGYAGSYNWNAAITSSTAWFNGVSWTTTGSVITARGWHLGYGCVDFTSYTYSFIAGGYDSSNGNLRSSEIFDPFTNTWSSGGNMSTVRVNQGGGAGGKTAGLAFGGMDASNSMSSAEKYQAAVTWTLGPPANTGLTGQIRFNANTGKFQAYNGSSWVVFA